jgi:anthranilate/para-aminobenzoate synthase component I
MRRDGHAGDLVRAGRCRENPRAGIPVKGLLEIAHGSSAPARIAWRPLVFELPRGADPLAALAGLDARRRPVLLDSAAGVPRRFTLLAFDPLRVLPDDVRDLLAVQRLSAALEPAATDAIPGPFHGGFLGALAYDLGCAGERPVAAAPEPWGFPLAVGGLYTDFVVRDEASGEGWLVLDEHAGDGRASVAERRAELLELLAAEPRTTEARVGRPRRHVAPEEHCRRIELVRERIARGDVYQVNLAHRFSAETAGAPHALYSRLRAVNPAPFMAYLAWEQGAILSASPELLLEYDGREARTRPIKGTRRRGGGPESDSELARALLASEKDRAELTMIVDLERNDLGRIAQPGGVRVEGLPTLQSYASVHHLMADVVARPKPGVGALELVSALFPGGSVTGAPKLAAMDLIAQLEREGRGFYCGALGFIDARGRAELNLLIRTLLWRPRPDLGREAGEVSFQVGGGITWSSEARAEERETLDKAAGLLAALDARP